MKNLLVTIALSFSYIIAFGQNQLKLDKEFGFKNFRLETPKKTYRKLKFIKNESNSFCKVYEYRKGDISFNEIPIDVIKLRFYQNKLYNLQLIIKSNKNDSFLDFLTNQYGTFNGYGSISGLSEKGLFDYKEWLAEKAELKYVKTKENHYITFLSNKVYELNKEEILHYFIFL